MSKAAFEKIEAGLHEALLIARIDQLTSALRRIAEGDVSPTLDEPDTDFEVIQKMRHIARAALAQTIGMDT